MGVVVPVVLYKIITSAPTIRTMTADCQAGCDDDDDAARKKVKLDYVKFHCTGQTHTEYDTYYIQNQRGAHESTILHPVGEVPNGVLSL